MDEQDNKQVTGEDQPQDQPTGGGDDQQGGGLKDKHGEDAINKGHHDRIVKEKDDRIAELEKQLAEQTKAANEASEAVKKVDALERKLESEKVSRALEVAGCIDEKAARARLADFEGDVGKLREECPYLFQAARQAGSTGARFSGGAAKPTDELVSKAREAAGTTYLYKQKG